MTTIFMSLFKGVCACVYAWNNRNSRRGSGASHIEAFKAFHRVVWSFVV